MLAVLSGCSGPTRISTEQKLCEENIRSTEVSPELLQFIGFQPIDRADMSARLQSRMMTEERSASDFWDNKNEAIAAVDEAAADGAVFSVVTIRGGRLNQGDREVLCIAKPGTCECG